MARWISAELRQAIADRANLLCEYCLIAETDTFYGCQVDQIISLKHGGSSELDNLAYACALCTKRKEATLVQFQRPEISPDFSTLAPTVGQNTFV